MAYAFRDVSLTWLVREMECVILNVQLTHSQAFNMISLLKLRTDRNTIPLLKLIVNNLPIISGFQQLAKAYLL
jgi:hypothetical protein